MNTYSYLKNWDSEPITGNFVQVLSPIKETNKSNRHERELFIKIKKLGDTMHFLKWRIAHEKGLLARARWETESKPYLRRSMGIPETFSFPFNFGSNTNNFLGWRSLPYFQEYMLWLNDIYLGGESAWYHNQNSVSLPNYAHDVIPDMYKEHLQNMERMCQVEFDKVQASVSNFKTVKLTNNDLLQRSCGDIKSSRSPPKKRQKISHNKHSHRRKKTDNECFLNAKVFVNHEISPMESDEHHDHYRYHYNANRKLSKHGFGRSSYDQDELSETAVNIFDL